MTAGEVAASDWPPRLTCTPVYEASAGSAKRTIHVDREVAASAIDVAAGASDADATAKDKEGEDGTTGDHDGSTSFGDPPMVSKGAHRLVNESQG